MISTHPENSLPSPGNNLPTASASFLLFSAISLDEESRCVVPYFASLSSRAWRRLCLTTPYVVCRLAGTKYSWTPPSDRTIVVVCRKNVYEDYEWETTTFRVLTTCSSVKTELRCDRPIRLNSSSRNWTSIRMLEIAFSFIIGMFLPVKKSYAYKRGSISYNVLFRSLGKWITIKHSAIYATAPLYASSLYSSFITSESTTVVSQLTSSYRYMLGASSRDFGVQSYSESSKKSSNLEVISSVIRARARESVVPNDADAVRRIVPPRWADLDEQTRHKNIKKVKGFVADGRIPNICQGPFQLITCDLEVFKIGNDLGNLGKCRGAGESLSYSIADVIDEKAI